MTMKYIPILLTMVTTVLSCQNKQENHLEQILRDGIYLSYSISPKRPPEWVSLCKKVSEQPFVHEIELLQKLQETVSSMLKYSNTLFGDINIDNNAVISRKDRDCMFKLHDDEQVIKRIMNDIYIEYKRKSITSKESTRYLSIEGSTNGKTKYCTKIPLIGNPYIDINGENTRTYDNRLVAYTIWVMGIDRDINRSIDVAVGESETLSIVDNMFQRIRYDSIDDKTKMNNMLVNIANAYTAAYSKSREVGMKISNIHVEIDKIENNTGDDADFGVQ